ncbi:D-cysteine desulfhydrase [Acinetobacter sp. ANC 4558]|uniref:D-cysteine desulfhydrase n=1 Tax=Acinetobacter sp. ANC 4558 TaxID=1977876 RepID=UPI000A3559DC|nr:D-cysteine desulfhydrase [Acinetobacter sp. ANC 4558]OTG86737.1 D-cysteine desulfhydrase [Acinetobacter sp. ANC 4558]
MLLSHLPRVKLVQAPTPLEFLLNLTKALGGPEIYIKRDDATGLATGGNKTRKLEFLIGDAIAKGATHVITQGATQSNHVRQTIAAANKFGLKASAILEQRVNDGAVEYYNNGNVLLDEILGVHSIDIVPGGTDMVAALEAKAKALEAQGERPYIIPGGGSNAVGALGYVSTAIELIYQLNQLQLVPTHLVHATGSTGTQAGLLAGLAATNSNLPVLGISVRAEKTKQEENVYKLARATLEHLGLNTDILAREKVVANSDYVGEGYGIPTESMIEAVELLARTEGIFLDPVYSGKGFAGLVDLIRQGHFTKDDKVIFLHTGGAVGLFGYRTTFSEKDAYRI